jgi:uncharacterized protein
VPSILNIAARAGAAAQSLIEAGQGIVQPNLRLGVTGLARSGKTVFTTALVHHLMRLTPLPAFRPAAEGRIRRAQLAHQPDDDVPRFPYEANLDAMIDARLWPRSTTQIGELRLEIDYERASRWRSGPATLALDIVDYPGEWLLDLALIDTDYADWSRETLAASRRPGRSQSAQPWHEVLREYDSAGPADEAAAERASRAFASYLEALRAGPEAVATTPPGRFLMPGDLAGSPALTFAPLELPPGGAVAPGTLGGLMQRRFESYKARVGTVALASVRATRETTVRDGRETLRAVAGTPERGERIGEEIFDGEAEAAVFPGELPADPQAVLDGAVPPGSLRFPRFRPPKVTSDAVGRSATLPHIRLDRALDFLIGDKLT